MSTLDRTRPGRDRARWSTVAWAICLGSAVGCRLYRSSLVNKHNALLAKGREAPLQ